MRIVYLFNRAEAMNRCLNFINMKLFVISVCLVFIPFSNAFDLPDFNLLDTFNLLSDPDAHRNVSQLISSKGYPVEDYTAQTKDGYLLSVQRIPHGRKLHSYGKIKAHGGQKPVVFLQHGLLSSAADWVINFPTQSLGFILADAGYDVWLGNIRGNIYSRRHIKLTPEMEEFWNFSFDEMGKYDLPAMIDLALNVTGQKELIYIGHSQGTTCMFALLSENPEYNEKVKLFIALAPVATVGHITSPIRYLAPFASDIEFLSRILGIGEFLPNNVVIKFVKELVCDTPIKFLCEDIIFLVCGTDYSQLNATRLGVYVAHTPAGASTQSIIHYGQMVRSEKFQKFDYGRSGNMKHYNQSTPPEYHVENITTPVALLWSKNDKLADPTDIEFLQENLKSLVENYCVPQETFNHLDFVWGINANKLVYENVMDLLKKYSLYT